jgi:RHS repeat-associated protein
MSVIGSRHRRISTLLLTISVMVCLLTAATPASASIARRNYEHTRDGQGRLTDQVGSVIAVVAASGDIVNSYDYDAFGNLLAENTVETVANRYRFHGREYDAERGDYYYRYRTYIPEWGAFTGPDLLIDKTDPMGAANYTFCSNHPMQNVDPLGLSDESDLRATVRVAGSQLNGLRMYERRLKRSPSEENRMAVVRAYNRYVKTLCRGEKQAASLQRGNLYWSQSEHNVFSSFRNLPLRTQISVPSWSQVQEMAALAKDTGEAGRSLVATAAVVDVTNKVVFVGATVTVVAVGGGVLGVGAAKGGAFLVAKYGISGSLVCKGGAAISGTIVGTQGYYRTQDHGQSIGMALTGAALDITPVGPAYSAITNKDLTTQRDLHLSNGERSVLGGLALAETWILVKGPGAARDGAESGLEARQAAEAARARNAIPDYPDGSFSISNWEGYPEGMSRPDGPFRLLDGDEHSAARRAANAANRTLHAGDPSLAGKHLHEIHPIKFGGDPTGSGNKIPLTPQEHAKLTAWWNRLMRGL